MSEQMINEARAARSERDEAEARLNAVQEAMLKELWGERGEYDTKVIRSAFEVHALTTIGAEDMVSAGLAFASLVQSFIPPRMGEEPREWTRRAREEAAGILRTHRR